MNIMLLLSWFVAPRPLVAAQREGRPIVRGGHEEVHDGKTKVQASGMCQGLPPAVERVTMDR